MSANCAAAAAAAARRCRRLRPSSSPLSAASAAATAAAMSGDSDRCRCCCCCWGGGFTTATSSSSSSSLSDRVMGVSCSKGGQWCDTNAKQQRVSCSHSKGGGSVARVQSSRGGSYPKGGGRESVRGIFANKKGTPVSYPSKATQGSQAACLFLPLFLLAACPYHSLPPLKRINTPLQTTLPRRPAPCASFACVPHLAALPHSTTATTRADTATSTSSSTSRQVWHPVGLQRRRPNWLHKSIAAAAPASVTRWQQQQ